MAEDAVNRVGRRYGVAANDDGASLWQYRQVPLSAERFLRAAVDRMAGADLLCWGVGNTRFWYGSNVTEDLDTGQQVFPTVQEWMAHTTLRSLRASGQEPLALVCGRCHRHGMHLYASLRMNDGHFSFPPPADQPAPGAPDFGVPHPDQLWNHQRGAQASPLTSEFWRRHPEYRIGENWPGSAFSADLLDYAHAEVRAWWLGVITDIAARFDDRRSGARLHAQSVLLPPRSGGRRPPPHDRVRTRGARGARRSRAAARPAPGPGGALPYLPGRLRRHRSRRRDLGCATAWSTC